VVVVALSVVVVVVVVAVVDVVVHRDKVTQTVRRRKQTSVCASVNLCVVVFVDLVMRMCVRISQHSAFWRAQFQGLQIVCYPPRTERERAPAKQRGDRFASTDSKSAPFGQREKSV